MADRALNAIAGADGQIGRTVSFQTLRERGTAQVGSVDLGRLFTGRIDEIVLVGPEDAESFLVRGKATREYLIANKSPIDGSIIVGGFTFNMNPTLPLESFNFQRFTACIAIVNAWREEKIVPAMAMKIPATASPIFNNRGKYFMTPGYGFIYKALWGPNRIGGTTPRYIVTEGLKGAYFAAGVCLDWLSYCNQHKSTITLAEFARNGSFKEMNGAISSLVSNLSNLEGSPMEMSEAALAEYRSVCGTNSSLLSRGRLVRTRTATDNWSLI